MSDNMSGLHVVLLWLAILFVIALVGAACARGWRRRLAILILVPLIGASILLLIGIWALGHNGS